MLYQFNIIKQLFLQKYWKLFLIFLSFFFLQLFLIFFNQQVVVIDEIDLYMLLGIFKSDFSFLAILWYLFQISMLIYFVYTIFIYEYENSIEFLSLRVSTFKRLVGKYLTTILFVICFRLFYFLLVFLIFKNYRTFYIGSFLGGVLFYAFLATICYLFLIMIFRRKE